MRGGGSRPSPNLGGFVELFGGGKQGSMPIGTVEEVKAQGMNPAKVATCSLRKSGEIQGCPMWSDCRFNSLRLGNFKTEGPRNVGYQLATGDVLPTGEPVVVENWCACHVFVRTLQNRMDEGEALRRKGLPGEFVAVCAQEGQEITVKMEFPFNIDGKVIKQDRRTFDMLKAQRIPVDENDKREANYWEYIAVKMKVPAHPRPGERGHLTYSQSIQERIKAQQERERQAEEIAFSTLPRIEATVGPEEVEAVVETEAKRIGRPKLPRDEHGNILR